jgi:filamentous hemagglutinin
MLQEEYGAENVTSTTIPPLSGKNVRLAGGEHPVTGIVFNEKGFPIFDDVAVYDTRLPIDQFRFTSYTGQMKMATGDLASAISRGQVPASRFTPQQLQNIIDGSSTIDGYTWHHHQDTGRMQLVPRDIHAQTGHVGWESMSEGR